AEALQELEEIYEFQRRNPWRTRDCAQKTVNAVALAIKRFRQRLASAVDAQVQPHRVLRGFAEHLNKYLIVPAGRGRPSGRPRFSDILAGCFNYRAPGSVESPRVEIFSVSFDSEKNFNFFWFCR